jgi:hypothetical protein
MGKTFVIDTESGVAKSFFANMPVKLAIMDLDLRNSNSLQAFPPKKWFELLRLAPLFLQKGDRHFEHASQITDAAHRTLQSSRLRVGGRPGPEQPQTA